RLCPRKRSASRTDYGRAPLGTISELYSTYSVLTKEATHDQLCVETDRLHPLLPELRPRGRNRGPRDRARPRRSGRFLTARARARQCSQVERAVDATPRARYTVAKRGFRHASSSHQSPNVARRVQRQPSNRSNRRP